MRDAIRNLRNTKVEDYYYFDAELIKFVIDVIIDPLSNIINQCILTSQCFPGHTKF